MPAMLILSVLLQFICIVHAIKSGRPYWWAFVIMLGSYIGVAVYFFVEILPELRHSPTAQRAVRKVAHKLDPQKERRRIEQLLLVADTVGNRSKLAEECLAQGDFINAEELFSSCLKGMHEHDPSFMLGLAKAQFGRADAAACKKTLGDLIQFNPEFRSVDGHLLFARSLEALGENQTAMDEYAAMIDGFPGEEARMRYAMMLKRLGRGVEARKLFEATINRAKVAPKYYQKNQREWIELAKEQLRAP